MDITTGDTVRFVSSTENAVLAGTVVRLTVTERMFSDFHSNDRYGWDSDEPFATITVDEVVQCEKDDYKVPTVCRVPAFRIETGLYGSDD